MIIARIGGNKMVLKKPYAFLIRHFKLIHLLICIPLVYLLIRTGAISNFLNAYVGANYYTSETNLAGTYINYFMYLAILLILLLVLTIFFLMKQKKKDTRYYIFFLGYYIILFVLISFCHSILDSIESVSIEAQTVRIYRDIAFIVWIPQFFFIGYTFLRGIGFDLKKFNFDEDAKELEITDIDNEEFELVFGQDAYKYKRTIRRFFREFRYYVLENKIAFGFLGGIIIIAIGTLIYLNFGVYNRVYRETQRVSHNNLTLTVEDSLLTKLALDGTETPMYHLAIAVKIKNNSRTNANKLDYENFQLDIDGRRFKPVLDQSGNYPDLGYAYSRDMEFAPNEEKKVVLVYEVDPSLINGKISLKILDSLTLEIGSVTPIFRTVNLDYETISTSSLEREVDLGKTLNLSDTAVGLTLVSIEDSQIANSYEYSYEKCTYNICQTLQNKVTSTPSSKLLIIKREFQIDQYTTYYNVRHGSGSFVNDFIKIRFQVGDTIYTANPNEVTPKELNDYWIFELPSSIQNAKSIDLIVNVRGKQYFLEVK